MYFHIESIYFIIDSICFLHFTCYGMDRMSLNGKFYFSNISDYNRDLDIDSFNNFDLLRLQF